MRHLLGALALTIALAAPALAQDGAPAEALIGQSRAEGVFEALPAEHLVVVRHERSGLICRLDPTHTNRLLIFPQAARGEDVACDSEGARVSTRIYATRYSFETDVDQQLAGAVAAIRTLHPDARVRPPTMDARASALPASRSAHFLIPQDGGGQLYSRVSVAMIGGWVIKMRYTAVAPDAQAAQQAELESTMLWNATLGEVSAQRV